MRQAIYEYIELTKEEKKALWESATFVFDTNVLLNLYRYTSKTRDSLLMAIEELKDRIWMPHHVAEEFMKDRYKIIDESSKLYEVLKVDADGFVEECAKKLNMVKKDTEMTELAEYINQWIDKLEKQNPKVQNSFEDSILDRLLSIFNEKVGGGFDDERIKEIEREGKERYDRKIPPGYMDQKDKKVNDNLYGDLIIWKEILQFAKDKGKDIIFITNDQKEDWWNNISGKTIGPRVELRKEFYDVTNKKHFHMYKMENFLSIYREGKGEEIDKTIIDEINAVSNESRPIYVEDTVGSIFNDLDALDAVRERKLTEKLMNLHRKNNKRMQEINRLQNQLRHYTGNPEGLHLQILNIEENISRTEKEISRLEKELMTIYSLRRGTRRMIISSEELEKITG